MDSQFHPVSNVHVLLDNTAKHIPICINHLDLYMQEKMVIRKMLRPFRRAVKLQFNGIRARQKLLRGAEGVTFLTFFDNLKTVKNEIF